VDGVRSSVSSRFFVQYTVLLADEILFRNDIQLHIWDDA